MPAVHLPLPPLVLFDLYCQIYSAASDGDEDTHSCRLWAYAGTSMSCPIVAGAAAMVRGPGIGWHALITTEASS